mmetsp:Transcript_18574/g.43640  ORF Transcript_18574/g.43640 Transcript_18574/m.43640 type:complete len:324 (-) Transcript_18574:88-1059(-)
MGDHVSKAVVCSFEEDDISHSNTLCSTRNNNTSGNGNEGGLSGTPVVRQSSCREDTLIIFDWDDTLLCSSAINTCQWTMSELKQLELVVASVLQAAMELGETMIVTNGNGTWVRESSQRFLPGLVPMLERLTVLSARAMYEQMYPGDPFSWKRQAFRQILKCRRAQLPSDGVNLVVLGDSPAEMEAAHSASRVYDGTGGHSLVKTVKFREAPSLGQLLGQIQLVAQELSDIVRDDRSVSKDLEQLKLPAHLGHLASGASGWKFTTGRDWSCSPTFLDALFSKDADEDIPLELPDWMVQLADKMTTWQRTANRVVTTGPMMRQE